MTATAVTYADWKQHRTCTRKVRYDSQVEANTVVLHIWIHGEWAWAYPCDYCGGWHTTSNDPPNG